MKRLIATGGRCPTRKRRFRDHTSAIRALKLIQGSGGSLARAYECPLCNGWHLTSQASRS